MPLSVLMLDIDGVRLINDAFGYAEGDRMLRATADIVRRCCRPGDVPARMGATTFPSSCPTPPESRRAPLPPPSSRNAPGTTTPFPIMP